MTGSVGSRSNVISFEEKKNTCISKNCSPPSSCDSAKRLVSPQLKRVAASGEDLSTSCANCNTKKTPLWRRAPNGDTLCNACGLYSKTNNAQRPNCMTKRARCGDDLDPSQDSRGNCPGDGNCNGTGGAKACDGCPVYHQQHDGKKDISCHNCFTTTTPLWRKDDEGNPICNACGLFYKLNKSNRPVTLKTAVIKRRKRVVVTKKSKQGDKVLETGSVEAGPSSVSSGSKKELPVPSIEEIPYSSYKKNKVPEYQPRRIISFSSEAEEQPSNSEAPAPPIISPISLEVNHDHHALVSSFKPPTPEYSYTHPSTFVTSEHSPNQYEPQPTIAWQDYPNETQAPPVVVRETLIAHRNKIQEEVENLNRLLSSTTSILQGIDRMIYPTSHSYNAVPIGTPSSHVSLPPLRYITESFTPEPRRDESRFQYLPPLYPPAPPHYYDPQQNYR